MITISKYILVSPARNEEAYIERTIDSVINQTTPPQRYIVVSDGSADRTDEIVQRHADRHHFITFIRAGDGNDGKKNFGSKVRAFNAGYERLTGLDYDFSSGTWMRAFLLNPITLGGYLPGLSQTPTSTFQAA